SSVVNWVSAPRTPCLARRCSTTSSFATRPAGSVPSSVAAAGVSAFTQRRSTWPSAWDDRSAPAANQSGWLGVTPVALKNRRTKRPNIDRYACSHRARDARRGPSLRRRAGAGTGRPFASWGAGATSRSSRGRLPTVLERGGLELDIPLELLDER